MFAANKTQNATNYLGYEIAITKKTFSKNEV